MLCASAYAIRLFILSMHNRVGPKVNSHEIGVADALAVVPMVLIILVFAFYPQFGLRRSQHTVTQSVAASVMQSGHTLRFEAARYSVKP